MAWLLGKAEEMLNKVDQSAADALQNEANGTTNWQTSVSSASHNKSHIEEHQFDSSAWLTQTSMSASKSVPEFSNVGPKTSILDHKRADSVDQKNGSLSHSHKNTATGGNQREPVSVTQSNNAKNSPSMSRAKKDKDEELFEFLNSPDTNSVDKKTKSALPSSARHSRHSSVSSTKSSNVGLTMVAAPTSDKPDDSSDQSTQDHEDETGSHHNNTSSGYHSNQEDSSNQQSSSLQLENKLLRREVSSLNEEMASVIQRAQHTHEELRMVQDQLRHHTQQMSGRDQLVRELQSRESDLNEALAAKDSQLAVLRVRLDEADRDLKSKTNILDKLESDRNRMMKDHTDSHGVQSFALESLKEKQQELEAALQREQEAYKCAQREGMERQHKLESEQQTLAENLTSTQRKWSEEKARVQDLTNQLKSSKSNVDIARQELTEYKDKAARILQSKDRLITTLKEGVTSGGTGINRSTDVELEELKQERDLLKEELQRSRMAAETLRVEIQDLEAQIQTDSDALMDQVHGLEDQLSEEKRHREDGEQEILKQKQELQYVNEEIVKQKTSLQSRINERENEIEKLRNQLTTKSLSSSSQLELEGRLHSLTESLIHKQTVVEALSTEKNSLVLQMERLERQYSDMQTATSRANSTAVRMDDDEIRQRVPTFMRESPSDTGVTRNMKRAVSFIDKFSIRLGVFLRRYPIARVFVIVYMLMLHFWTMVVLLTYQPEMHGSDHNAAAPAPPVDQ